MVKQLWHYLENSGSDLKFDYFCDKLEKFIREGDLRRFMFEIFDTLDENKITEQGLFTFMQTITEQNPNKIVRPVTLLGLNEVEKDMFVDLFAKDLCCVEQALIEKRMIEERNSLKPFETPHISMMDHQKRKGSDTKSSKNRK
jgi:hypothetical protein